MSRGRWGFTLLEAIIASTLATLVILLVTSVFLVQNNFYADVQRRSAVNESVRGVTEMLSTEIRAIPRGGFVSAWYDRLIYRVPLAMGGVCDQFGTLTILHLPLSGTGFDTGDVAGYAVRDAVGDWTYNTATWSSIFSDQGSGPAADCASVGADTTGATADYYEFMGLNTPPPISAGTTIMFYREMELKSQASVLDPRSYALYRAPYGESLVEFGHGLWGVWFCYRFEGNADCDFYPTVNEYDRIVEIRTYVIGHAAPVTGGEDYYTVYWTVDIPIRNY